MITKQAEVDSIEKSSLVFNVVTDLIKSELEDEPHTAMFFQQLNLDLQLLNTIVSLMEKHKKFCLEETDALVSLLRRIAIYEKNNIATPEEIQIFIQKTESIFFGDNDVYQTINAVEYLNNFVDCVRAIFLLCEIDRQFQNISSTDSYYAEKIELVEYKVYFYEQLKQNITKSV